MARSPSSAELLFRDEGEHAFVCRARQTARRTAALRVCKLAYVRSPHAVAARQKVVTDTSCGALRVGPTAAARSQSRESLCAFAFGYATHNRCSFRPSSSETMRMTER